MIAMLRTLAADWADKRFINANNALRRKLTTAEATIGRLNQEHARLRNTIRSSGQLCAAYQQASKQAESDRDAALTQMHQMEAERDQAREALDAAGIGRGGLDAAWADVTAVHDGRPQ